MGVGGQLFCFGVGGDLRADVLGWMYFCVLCNVFLRIGRVFQQCSVGVVGLGELCSYSIRVVGYSMGRFP